MYKSTPELRLTVVQYYLNSGKTLKATARKFKLHYQTVFKWVKLYKTEGKDSLLSNYRRPWNRTEKSLEEKVMLLKENKPSLTIAKAKQMLERDGYEISFKGIWGIWKRYGITKRNANNPRSPFGLETKETADAIKRAKKYISEGKPFNAATVLNQLPSCPPDQILTEIPEKFLSLRRRLELLALLLGKLPFPEYAKKAKGLQSEFEKRKLYYSAFLAGLFHLNALQWMSTPEKELPLIRKLRGFVTNVHDPAIRFVLNADEAKSRAILLEPQKAVELLRQCKTIIYRKENPYFLAFIGSIFTFLQDFKSALPFLERAMKSVTSEERKQTLAATIALCLAEMGKYSDSIKYLSHAKRNTDASISMYFIVSSFIAFGKVKLTKAFTLAESTLKITKKSALHSNLITFAFLQASVYAALGKPEKAFAILRKYLPLMKSRIILFTLAQEILSKRETHSKDNPNQSTGFLSLNLLHRLKKAQKTKKYSDYVNVLHYAKKKGLVGMLHRFIVFFPDIINIPLKKEKPAGLPKAILRLPVFNKEFPVYNINFLGKLTVYKNQNYMKVKLGPKDTAFLIHFALKAEEPGKNISLESIYNNFWKRSGNPGSNLSHLLLRIKRELKMPSHLLEISKRKSSFVLTNKGIHFLTDYREYRRMITQAKALKRAGEWRSAKKEFVKAFSLIRNEPFKKMYDDWSDDKRLEILFGYESDILAFAKDLIVRGKNKEAAKMIMKAKRIISDLQDMKEL